MCLLWLFVLLEQAVISCRVYYASARARALLRAEIGHYGRKEAYMYSVPSHSISVPSRTLIRIVGLLHGRPGRS